MATNHIHEDVPGGVPLKMWTRGVPVEDEARRQLTSAARLGFGEDAEVLLRGFVARTPAVVEQVQREVPAGLSQLVHDKVLSGLLRAARALETAAN